MLDSFHEITTPQDVLRALDRARYEPVVFYKHSNMCFTSLRARQRMLALTEPGDPPVYEVVVQRARAASGEIAARLGVRHESPQVILVAGSRVLFSASHSAVQPDAIRAALADAQPA